MEVRSSTFGFNTPPEVIIEIEDIRAKLNELSTSPEHSDTPFDQDPSIRPTHRYYWLAIIAATIIVVITSLIIDQIGNANNKPTPIAAISITSMPAINSPTSVTSSLNNTAQTAISRPFYFADFDRGIGSEWSNTATTETPSKRKFLGKFDNELIFLTLKDLPPHAEVTVSFDLFIIGSWDGIGNGTQVFPYDFWGFNSGTFQYRTTFANNEPENLAIRQSYPSEYQTSMSNSVNPPQTGAIEKGMLGLSNKPFEDTVYHINGKFSHQDSFLTIKFYAQNLDGDEKWGLDNVKITLDK